MSPRRQLVVKCMMLSNEIYYFYVVPQVKGCFCLIAMQHSHASCRISNSGFLSGDTIRLAPKECYGVYPRRGVP